jgi:hypothetical protein
MAMGEADLGAGSTTDYWFNVTVSKPFRDSISVSSYVTVVPSTDPVPTVEIEQLGDTLSYLNQDDVLVLVGNASLGAGDYQWSATPDVNLTRTTGDTSITTKSLFLQPYTLTPGVTYVFTLEARTSATGTWGASSIQIYCNEPPTPGTFTVTPKDGPIHSASTEVLLSASNFIDADEPIEYRFEYDIDGKRQQLSTWSSTPSLATAYLPQGTLYPVLKVRDTRFATTEIFLGCEDAVDVNGASLMNSPLCSTRESLTVLDLPRQAGQSASDAVNDLLTSFEPANVDASTVINLVGSSIGALNSDNSTANVDTRMLLLDMVDDVLDRAEPAAAAGTLRDVVQDTRSLETEAVRLKVASLTENLLDNAQEEGLDEDSSASILQVIASSTEATSSTETAANTSVLIRKLTTALSTNVPLNGDETIIETSTVKLAVKKMSSEQSFPSTTASSEASVSLPAVSFLDGSGSSRRLLSDACTSDVLVSVNSWELVGPYSSTPDHEFPRSGVVGVEVYCGQTQRTVTDLTAGNEIQLCIKLDQSTSAARCMHRLSSGSLSDTGVETLGVSSDLDWPIAKTAGEEVCCSTNHLSDFMVVEGLYIQDWLPAKNAVNISKDTNIELTFNREIQLGTGSITIQPVGGQGTNTVRSISVNDATRVSIVNGTTLVIDFASALDDRSDKEVEVTLPSGAVLGLNGYSYSGFNGTIYSFTLEDSTGPQVASLDPPDDALYVELDTSITISYDETIALVGNIFLVPNDPLNEGHATQTYTNSDAAVTVTGTSITIQPQQQLVAGITYTVYMSNSSVHDMESPFNYAPVLSWSFTTRVVVLSTFPVNNRVDVMQTTPITFELDGPAATGLGHVIATQVNPTAVESQFVTYAISFELYKFHVDGLISQALDLAVGNTYTFDLTHSTMVQKPFVLLQDGALYTAGVTFMLNGLSVSSSVYLAGYESATSRELVFTPTEAADLVYDCYTDIGIGASTTVTSPSSQLIDISSSAVTADGAYEVVASGKTITITPVAPLFASSLITVTLATGVVANLVGPVQVNFTTCDCICYAARPYEIASDDFGAVSSGIDRGGARTCQWSVSASPGTMLSLSVLALDIPAVGDSTNYDCGNDYLEIRDGADIDARVVWRMCGTEAPFESYDSTTNAVHLMLVTSGASNASFTMNYGEANRELQPVFGAHPLANGGPPPQVGNDISISWSTSEPIPSSGAAWVGLYNQGYCNEDNEWRHKCHLATFALPAGATSGVAIFPYGDSGYRSSGYYDVRFFSGISQGLVCNVQNRQIVDDETSYSKCQLEALATQTVYVAAAGSVPMSHVPGTKEYDHNYRIY